VVQCQDSYFANFSSSYSPPPPFPFIFIFLSSVLVITTLVKVDHAIDLKTVNGTALMAQVQFRIGVSQTAELQETRTLFEALLDSM